WSGPRNISTAMMRSWENRGDTYVCDEPLYAFYLRQTGLEHPGREEILEHHDSDVERIIDWLVGPISEGKRIFYQKQMAHHLLPEVPRDWLSEVTNVFLIRDPTDMITSLMQVIPDPGIEETGLPQQVEIFDKVKRETGVVPPVIDARDVLDDPPRLLAGLCEAVGVDFRRSMLEWPPGRRETDGIWAPHWYSSVERSTGFQSYTRKDIDVPERLLGVLEEAQRHYDELYAQRLK
ncbi:MAG: HAD family hydrolase, partial [Gammaproteobacteria bacterium]|nr:HAD family hydrolase [Gammaproteobacteria bacterium]